jgi:hypothetical protein
MELIGYSRHGLHELARAADVHGSARLNQFVFGERRQCNRHPDLAVYPSIASAPALGRRAMNVTSVGPQHTV